MTDTSNRPPVVAIDGPSGVGKSSVARRLARRLDLPFVDTGAMFRCIALLALRRGLAPENEEAIAELSASIDLDLEVSDGFTRLLLEGEPVGDEIRSREVSLATSKIARYSSVREVLLRLQREFGGRYGGVLEGRDIGTVVFPDTPDKFFLDAEPATRAERRTLQLRAAGKDVDLDQVREELEQRDRNDSERDIAPLQCDATYFRVDTGALSEDEVVDLLEHRVRARLARAL